MYVSYAWLCSTLSTSCDEIHGKSPNESMWCPRVIMCTMLVLFTIWLNVLLDMYVVDYGIMFDVWSTGYDACGIMICLISMCEVMGLLMYIALVDLD